ncbi:MAG: ChaB family protein [Acidimicrobiaceae bacterium]|nr:ChaB family protein [Acidimicrobiaceae bacterium]
MPSRARKELPSTIERSPAKAQRTYAETLESAEKEYSGDEARAHRVAYSALKHSFEKVGDHWEPKDGRGPSDAQAARGGTAARDRPRSTNEGVNANASKAHLLEVAKRLDVRGRSSMTKDELVEAIEKANRRATAQARR